MDSLEVFGWFWLIVAVIIAFVHIFKPESKSELKEKGTYVQEKIDMLNSKANEVENEIKEKEIDFESELFDIELKRYYLKNDFNQEKSNIVDSILDKLESIDISELLLENEHREFQVIRKITLNEVCLNIETHKLTKLGLMMGYFREMFKKEIEITEDYKWLYGGKKIETISFSVKENFFYMLSIEQEYRFDNFVKKYREFQEQKRNEITKQNINKFLS